MTVVIASKNDLGRVTRFLTAHTELTYTSSGGSNGEIVLFIPELAPGTQI